MIEESATANSFQQLADWLDEADKIIESVVGPDEAPADSVQDDLRALATFLDYHPRIAQRLDAVLRDGEWDLNVEELRGHNASVDLDEDLDDIDAEWTLTDKGRIALLDIEVEELRSTIAALTARVVLLEANRWVQPYVQPYQPNQPYVQTNSYKCQTCGTWVMIGTYHSCHGPWVSPFTYSAGQSVSDKTE